MTAKGIAILGSTGSIGCNTLRVIESLGSERFPRRRFGRGKQHRDSRRSNCEALPGGCFGRDRSRLHTICARGFLKETSICRGSLWVNQDWLKSQRMREADCVVSATVGAVGFVPTLRALEAGKRVALANKETLVMAGELMTRAAQASGAELLPVDSEHNALHQCLRGENRHEVRRIVLTASGGPFRTKSLNEMQAANCL